MMNGKYILFHEAIGSMLTAKVHVFSDSVFCTAPGALDSSNASAIWNKKAEAVLKKQQLQEQKRHCKSAD